jgi:hypothetical protein
MIIAHFVQTLLYHQRRSHTHAWIFAPDPQFGNPQHSTFSFLQALQRRLEDYQDEDGEFLPLPFSQSFMLHEHEKALAVDDELQRHIFAMSRSTMTLDQGGTGNDNDIWEVIGCETLFHLFTSQIDQLNRPSLEYFNDPCTLREDSSSWKQ